MLALVLVALLALILFGVGFTVHVLWWVAIVLAVVWLIGALCASRRPTLVRLVTTYSVASFFARRRGS